MPVTRRSASKVVEDKTFSHHNNNDTSVDYNEDYSSSDEELERSSPQKNTSQLSSSSPSAYVFDGVAYTTYQEMVDAKRKRNQAVLKGLGFQDSSSSSSGPLLSKLQSSKPAATQRGIKRQKKAPASSVDPRSLPRRKSSRLSTSKSTLVALDYYVNDWNRNNSIINVEKGDNMNKEEEGTTSESNSPEFHKGRLNDGSDLTIEDAVEMMEKKWIQENTIDETKSFVSNLRTTLSSTPEKKINLDREQSSPTTVIVSSDVENDLSKMVDDLSIDNEEWVAKVTPDRIYSVAAHPSEHKLIACAGDKNGYIGLWDVDSSSPDDSNNNNNNNGVNLFRVHSRPICGLQWATPESMISASYDGSVRRLNVEKGVFEEIFATYDDSDTSYVEELGFGLDEGYRFWHQHVSLDPRSINRGSDPCLFLATSVGKAMHIDLRSSGKQKITFNEQLSEKKINTLSLHPNGYTLASAGNDGTVNLWDIRKFKGTRQKAGIPKPVASHSVGLSVSSSVFSPSGDCLLSTSFANKLDLVERPQTLKGSFQPDTRIAHNNQTGRWLSTFMATWHPKQDIFVCGSMKRPRAVEIFHRNGDLLREISGDSLTAVSSRCCFHPSTDKLVVIGGNSSGRVVVIR